MWQAVRVPGPAPAQMVAGEHKAPPPDCAGGAPGSLRACALTNAVLERFTGVRALRRRRRRPLAVAAPPSRRHNRAAPLADRIGGSAPGPSGAIWLPLWPSKGDFVWLFRRKISMFSTSHHSRPRLRSLPGPNPLIFGCFGAPVTPLLRLPSSPLA